MGVGRLFSVQTNGGNSYISEGRRKGEQQKGGQETDAKVSKESHLETHY